MALAKNISYNAIAQIYVALIGVLLVPLYVQYMGASAYGLVGLASTIQALFNMLDLGLTPTISRESSKFSSGVIDALQFRRIFRSLSVVFVSVAIMGGGALFFSSSAISEKWLNTGDLPINEVEIALRIIAITVALRWICGLYKGVITGSEQLIWISGFTILLSTLRFVMVLPVMYVFGFTIKTFFIHQLVVSIIEFAVLFGKSSFLLPNKESFNHSIGWSFSPIKDLLSFGLTIAFTSTVWVFATQTDRFVLSGVLSLSDYGYYSVAVLVAGVVSLVGNTAGTAIMPRLTRLYSERKYYQEIEVYRGATQLVSMFSGVAGFTVIVFSKHLLFAWSGDEDLTNFATPVLQLYAAGNIILAVASFPYYLQYSRGNLKYHLRGNFFTVIFLIPAFVFAAYKYGAIGTGLIWLSINALYLFTWLGYVHAKLVPGLHVKWLIRDVIITLIPSAIVIYCMSTLLNLNGTTRMHTLFCIIMTSLLALVGSLIVNRCISGGISLKKLS